MRQIRALAASAALAALVTVAAGCQQAAQITTSVCTDIAQIPPPAAATLNSLDPHSALGVYWADAKSACTNGVPTSGVGTDWANQMWGAVKGLIPQVLPSLLPILVGLL